MDLGEWAIGILALVWYGVLTYSFHRVSRGT